MSGRRTPGDTRGSTRDGQEIQGRLRGIALLGAAFLLGTGGWAFVAPASFYEAIAPYPPFHEHFLRDGGALSMGLGVTLLAALRWRDGLTVALVGATAAFALHSLSHFIDRDHGGRAIDPYGLALFAIILGVGFVRRAKSVQR